MKQQPILILLAVLVLGAASGYFVGRSVAVPEVVSGTPPASTVVPPASQVADAAPVRDILLTVDDPANPDYEVVLGVVDFSPGADTGRHDHPGIEVGYILEGTIEMMHDGRVTAILSAGSSFHNDAPHRAVNVGSTPGRLVAVWIVEKGRPMAEPVP